MILRDRYDLLSAYPPSYPALLKRSFIQSGLQTVYTFALATTPCTQWSNYKGFGSASGKLLGTLDWFGIVNIRIQRPSRPSVLTVLKDCEPADTCITASVRPCVGRMPPMLNGR